MKKFKFLKKKLISLALMTVLGVTTLTGCGSNDPSTAKAENDDSNTVVQQNTDADKAEEHAI